MIKESFSKTSMNMMDIYKNVFAAFDNIHSDTIQVITSIFDGKHTDSVIKILSNTNDKIISNIYSMINTKIRNKT